MAPVLALALVAPWGSEPMTGPDGGPNRTIEGLASTSRQNYTPGWTNVSHGLGENEVPAARAGSAGAYFPPYSAWVVFGGVDAQGVTLNDTLMFVTGEGEWAILDEFWNGTRPSSPPPLTGAALTYDAADGYLLLFGGRLSNGSLTAGTWMFSGATWNELRWTQGVSTGVSPPSSSVDRMAYDALDGCVILYTGTGPYPTWTYRAGVWTPVTNGEQPAVLAQPVLVDDPALGGVVLLGVPSGASGTPSGNDAWIFRAGAWTSPPDRGAPPTMISPLGVYDVLDGYLLVVGATGGSGPSGGIESTWSLEPTGWTNRSGSSATAPPARAGAVMVEDALDGAVLLYGGGDLATGAALGDFWAWNLNTTPPDLRTAAFPLSAPVLLVVGVGGVVPPAIAWVYFRRPPRRQPSDVPAPTPAPA